MLIRPINYINLWENILVEDETLIYVTSDRKKDNQKVDNLKTPTTMRMREGVSSWSWKNKQQQLIRLVWKETVIDSSNDAYNVASNHD